MKKHTKHLFSLMLTVVMMFAFAISGFAAGVVTIKSNGEKHIFAPGDIAGYSSTDLFDKDFKNLMPGDTIDTYTVRISNDGKSGYTTKIYMRALGPNEIIINGSDIGTEETKKVNQALLGYFDMTIKSVDGKTTYFDASADKTDGLTDWVLLGSLRKGGEVDLILTLSVDLELGSDDQLTDEENAAMQNAAAAIDWQFKVEEIKDPAPVVPDTGDNTGLMMYAGIFTIAAMALLVIIVLKKRTNEE